MSQQFFLLVEHPLPQQQGEKSKVVLASINPTDIKGKGNEQDFSIKEVELDGVPDEGQEHAFVVRQGEKYLKAFCHRQDAAQLAYSIEPTGSINVVVALALPEPEVGMSI